LSHSTPAYLNGQFLPLAEASIPVLDRGFIFGDGVYEVIPCYGGQLFRLPQHLARLHHSLAAIDIKLPLDDSALTAVLERLVAECPSGDCNLYLQITRGVAPRAHSFPIETTPTVFAMAEPLTGPPQHWLDQGVAAITQEDIRWHRCDIKTTALLANILLRQAATTAGAEEAILVRDEQVLEGAASNLFIVIDGTAITPRLGHELLHGVTRDVILELCHSTGIAAKEAPVTQSELLRAEEIWLTSSTREIIPVTRLDQQPVGDGRPGPLWHRVHAALQQQKETLRQQASPQSAVD